MWETLIQEKYPLASASNTMGEGYVNLGAQGSTSAPTARGSTGHQPVINKTSPLLLNSLPLINQTQELPTPVNPTRLQVALKGYGHSQYLVGGFRQGFKLGCEGSPPPVSGKKP